MRERERAGQHMLIKESSPQQSVRHREPSVSGGRGTDAIKPVIFEGHIYVIAW